jgi:Rieske Fe-S protein
MNPDSTRYPRRTLLSWCLGALATGSPLPSIGRRLLSIGRRRSSTSATRSRSYLDLTSPVVLPWEAIAEPWNSQRFEARVPRRDPAAGDVLLEGILLRTGASGATGDQGGAESAAGLRSGDRALPEVQAFCLLCPHEICHVEYQTDTSRVELETGATPEHPLLVCACHFSVFNPVADGARISGPAYRGLYRFKVQVERDTVRITQVEEEVLTLLDAVSPDADVTMFVDAVSPQEEARTLLDVVSPSREER